jgi:uncharacterized YigZ family protein
MKTLTRHTEATLEVKRSKFIAHLFPYEMFDAVMAGLREAHPKGRHFVNAHRHINVFDQVVEGCSDDGEPKGTSGKPTLAVLQGHGLVNVGIITVRYFGGIKLGTGGLVRAYGDAANLVISEAELLEYRKEYTKRFACDYGAMGVVEYEMEQCGVRAADKSFEAAEVVITAVGTEEALATFFAKVERRIRTAE